MKTGLALGSGSARGLAHFGVIKALKQHDIQIDCIAGSSIGAVVGAALASNNHASLEKAYRRLDKRSVLSLMDLVIPRSGFIEGERAMRFVSEHYDHDNIEDLKIPFVAIATDILTGSEITLNQGSLSQAIRASCAVPGLLTPVKWDNWILADGGMVNPVPVSSVRELGADKIIAVNLSHNLVVGRTQNSSVKRKQAMEPVNSKDTTDINLEKRSTPDWLSRLKQPFNKLDYPALNGFKNWLKEEPLPGIFDVLMASVDIMETQITQARLASDKPDLIIQPDLGYIRSLDFHKANEIINEGYRAAIKALDESSIF